MEEKVNKKIEEINFIWNNFLEKVNYKTEPDLDFLSLYNKTLKEIEKQINKLKLLVFEQSSEVQKTIDSKSNLNKLKNNKEKD